MLCCMPHELDHGYYAVPMLEGENFDFGSGLEAPE